MGYASHQGRHVRVSSRNPQAAAQCDRCGFLYNHVDLRWQFDWRGASLMNTRMLVCSRCEDDANAQLRAIVTPPDPMPIMNARPPDYYYATSGLRGVAVPPIADRGSGLLVPGGGDTRGTQDGLVRTRQQTGEPPEGFNQQPGTDANAPGDADPGLPRKNVDVPETGPLE